MKMIQFDNPENNLKLKFNIAGYQFPEDVNDDWCLLNVEIVQGNNFFNKIDPAIETTELVELSKWFMCLRDKKLPRYSELSFTEPCITFKYLSYKNEIVRISIELDYELQPNFELEQFGSTQEIWDMIFELNTKEINEILSSLDMFMGKYPIINRS